jgi:hypothetical protein
MPLPRARCGLSGWLQTRSTAPNAQPSWHNLRYSCYFSKPNSACV